MFERDVIDAMFEAFSGLGVFIEDEKSSPGGDAAAATAGAAVAAQTNQSAGRMDVDDVF